MLTVERYRKTRFWAVYEAGDLLCVTVYKKGANAIRERLERSGIAIKDDKQKPSMSPPN